MYTIFGNSKTNSYNNLLFSISMKYPLSVINISLSNDIIYSKLFRIYWYIYTGNIETIELKLNRDVFYQKTRLKNESGNNII